MVADSNNRIIQTILAPTCIDIRSGVCYY